MGPRLFGALQSFVEFSLTSIYELSANLTYASLNRRSLYYLTLLPEREPDSYEDYFITQAF